MPPRQRFNGYDIDSVVMYDRDEFLDEVWDYNAGEHVTILAPSGYGKTHLSYQLLARTARSDLQAVVLVMKPRDDTVTAFTKSNGFKIVHDWPPSKVRGIFEQKPRGYTLWPKEGGDPDYYDIVHAMIFKRAIRDNYNKGDRITFADEIMSLIDEYNFPPEVNMRREVVRIWSKGRSMDNGLWAATQRPAFVPRYAYQAHHLFLANDPDEDVQKRYGEIGGGIGKQLVQELCGRIDKYQFIYIHRDTRSLCIVDA